VVVSPDDAHVSVDGKDLGLQPQEIRVGSDPVTIVISRDGYDSQTIALTASKARQTFTLKKSLMVGRYPISTGTGPKAATTATATAPPQTKATGGGDDVPVPSVFQQKR
jgi:hypothetical protein